LAHFSGSLSGSLSDLSGSLPSAFTYLLRSPSGTLGGLACAFTDFLGSLSRPLAYFLRSLACALTDILDCGTRTFAYLADRVARTFTDLAYRMTRARAHVFYGRAGARPNIFYGRARARAYILNSRACAFTDVFHRVVESLAHKVSSASADILDRRARTGPYILHRVVEPFAHKLACACADVFHSRIEPLAHKLAGTLTHIFDRRAHALDEPLDDLRVAVYGGEDPVDDGGNVVEPDLEERLCFDALYNELDPAEVRVDPDRELHEVKHLRVERHLGPQIVELEVDLVHLDDRHVEQHVGNCLVAGGAIRVIQHVVGVLLLRDGLIGRDVRREPVLLGFLDRGPGIVLPYRGVIGDLLRRPIVYLHRLILLRLIGSLLRRCAVPLLRLRRLILVLSCHPTSPLFP
jgi:hypothetical protein